MMDIKNCNPGLVPNQQRSSWKPLAEVNGIMVGAGGCCDQPAMRPKTRMVSYMYSYKDGY